MNKTRKMFLLTAINGMLMMEKYNLIFFFLTILMHQSPELFYHITKDIMKNPFQTAEESFVSVKADFYELTIILIRF